MSGSTRLPRWLRGALARRLARPIASADATRARSACLYKVDRLGDFVLATGALRLLVGHFGPANCRLVVSAQAAPLAAAEFPEVARWTAPVAASGVWRELRPLRRALAREWADERSETLVCLRHARSLYHDLTLTWLAAENWCGLGARPSAARLTLGSAAELAAGYPATAAAPWCRELLAHRTIVSAALGREVTFDEIRPQLRSAPVSRGHEIVVCPFGGDRIRDYPLASWVAAWRTAIEPGAEVLVLGASERRTALEEFASALRGVGARARAEADASLPQFVQALARARLVLTVESAAAHIATTLDKPAVVLLGGGHHGWFAPWGRGERQRWVDHPLDCYGCDWTCRRARVECLLDLPPARVARALQEVMPHA